MSIHPTRPGGPWRVTVFQKSSAGPTFLAGSAYRTGTAALEACQEVHKAYSEQGLQIFIAGPQGSQEWQPERIAA